MYSRSNGNWAVLQFGVGSLLCDSCHPEALRDYQIILPPVDDLLSACLSNGLHLVYFDTCNSS